MKGSIDVICCPIALESLERMFSSLVSTFEALHPISVVNHLHAQSVSRVESRNTLKKEKSLDLQVGHCGFHTPTSFEGAGELCVV